MVFDFKMPFMKSKLYKHDFQTFIGDLNGVNKIDQSLVLPERFAIRSFGKRKSRKFTIANVFYGLMILSTVVWLARFVLYPVDSIAEIAIGGLVFSSNFLLSKYARI